MRWVTALLAAALTATALAACGSGAEPGAPAGASLMLDFSPNAVHSGIYAAEAAGDYRDAGVELTIRQPGDSSDAPKLLGAGRVDFAILDIHDLGIARERGIDVIGLTPIVARPLASVIVRADGPVRRPRDLVGRSVGVTGLPSDDAVLDSEVAADGGDPAAVHRIVIGFNAVTSLAAGRVDGVLGFRNAEAVALRRAGVPVRIFPVERYGAPPYPELVLATSASMLREHPRLVREVVHATRRGSRLAARQPISSLDALLKAVPSLDAADQRAQMRALNGYFPTSGGGLHPAVLRRWAAWDLEHGILGHRLDIGAAFPELSRIRSGG